MRPQKNHGFLGLHKRGISELIAYVLLVALAVAMAGAVYAWLNSYVKEPFPKESCPEVGITISEYKCEAGILNLTVENRGLFNFDGYILKANDGTRDYALPSRESSLTSYVPAALKSREKQSNTFSYTGSIKSVKIEVITLKDGKPTLCKDSLLKQNMFNC